MSIKQTISEDMKTFMRAKDTARLGAVRLLQASIKQKEIDDRVELTDDQVLSVIQKMLKQRKDSIEAYQKADRQDLIDQEQLEIDVLSKYMPEPLTDDEVSKIIDEVIKNTYRTLLSRGLKGCYIYCCDDELQEHLRDRISRIQR